MTYNNRNKIKKQSSDYSTLKVSLSSPEDILAKSSGEVTKPETINYRTYKPERDGLFCERIFGPTKDFECHCGKYKRIRYRGIVCDRCGVEVTEKKVRRERVGHINLVVPVAHIWYFRTLPNKIGYLLGLPSKKMDQIIYYERYVVIQTVEGALNEEGNQIEVNDFITEEEYLNVLENLDPTNQHLSDSDENKFIGKMGAEALIEMLSRVDLISLSRISAVLNCDVIRRSFADCLKSKSSLTLISFLTDLTPSVSQAILVNFNLSSGFSTFPVKKILPSKTFDFTDNRYFLSNKIILADKFFCIIESSIWVPTDLGSKATLTPVPNTPLEETPTQPDKIIAINNNINLFFIFKF